MEEVFSEPTPATMKKKFSAKKSDRAEVVKMPEHNFVTRLSRRTKLCA